MSVLWALASWLFLASPDAQPSQADETPMAARGPTTITVRGSTRLDLEKTERAPGGVVLTVRLLDGELSEPIPDRTITVIIRKDGLEVQRATRQTTRTGSAQIFVPHQKGEHEISLGFEGDALYRAASPSSSRVDLSKETVQLRLSAPPQVDIGTASLHVVVHASQDGPVAKLPIGLRARRGDRIVLSREGSTDAEGQLRIELPTRELGNAGEVMLEAQSTTTAEYNSARTSQRIFLVSATTTSLRLSRAQGRRDSKVLARGEVRDSAGPVERGTVRLIGLGRTLRTLQTDSSGRYSAPLPIGQLPLGALTLEAEFVPRTAWLRPSRSSPVVFTVLPHRPIPIAYYLVPTVLTLLFLAAMHLARRKPWQKWRIRGRLRSGPARPEQGGIELGRRHSIRGLFGVDMQGIRGKVIDLHEGTPLGGATIYLRARRAGSEDMQTRTGDGGAFSFAETAAGDWELLATLPGYLPVSLHVTLPHRGELHGVTVRLQSVRHRVMDLYSAVMAPRLPEPALVRFWTPSEAAAHLRASRGEAPAAVEALADLASEVYYGPATPEPETATDAELLASKARLSATPVEDAQTEEDDA
ncbi:MAG: carboxypeptidase regulatory-like domain-containing protein [Polyangia bacterium]|jgi:hypothetical protein|nr:carboxypeptidase regulatory-like domain-containing protein [Polyangia bacterium]